MAGQIEYQLVRPAIELLRERDDRLGPPLCSICRAPDGKIEALLFDDASNSQGEYKAAALMLSNIDFRTGSGFADRCLGEEELREHRLFPHSGTINTALN